MLLPAHRDRPSSAMYPILSENGQVRTQQDKHKTLTHVADVLNQLRYG